MKLYAIKDCKSVSFTPNIMCYPNQFAAERDIQILVNSNEKSLLYLFPQDFELYQLGEIDEKTGVLTANLEFVINLADLKTTHEATQ